MRHTLGFIASLIMLPVSLSGCAKDSCAVEPTGAECLKDPGTENPDDPLATAVLPKRISKKAGATLTIQVAGYGGAKVSLNQGNANLEMGALDANGHLVRTLNPTELLSYTLGEAQLIVQKTGLVNQSLPLRIFSDPSFDIDPTMQHWATRDVRRDAATNLSLEPVMIGVISSRQVQVLSQYTSGNLPNQKQVALFYQPQTGVNPAIPPTTGGFFLYNPVYDMKTPVGFAMSDVQTLFAGKESGDVVTPSRIVQCLGSTATSCTVEQPYAALKMAMLCGERSGRLIAGLVDGSVRAFSDYFLQQAVPIDAPDSLANLEVAAIAAGDLDGDRAPDLAVFYKTAGAEAVYLGGPNGLTFSEVYSKGLQSATKELLGGAVPTAARLGDLDGDLLDDLVLSSGTKLVVATNQADAGFARLSSWNAVGQSPNALGEITSIGIGALSSTPKASILLTARATNRIALLFNQATD